MILWPKHPMGENMKPPVILQALLLSDHCDVGIGARKGLLRLGVAPSTTPRQGLSQVTRQANASETVSARLEGYAWRAWYGLVGVDGWWGDMNCMQNVKNFNSWKGHTMKHVLLSKMFSVEGFREGFCMGLVFDNVCPQTRSRECRA